MNKVIMMGRIASDLELKQTPNGVFVCSFRFAVDRNYQKKGEEKVTDFFNVVAWRGTAEFITTWFSKGKLLLIEGELQTRKYTDKNGAPAIWHEIIVENAYFTGEKSDRSAAQSNASEYTQAPPRQTAPQTQNYSLHPQTAQQPQTAQPPQPQEAPPLGDDDYPF